MKQPKREGIKRGVWFGIMLAMCCISSFRIPIGWANALDPVPENTPGPNKNSPYTCVDVLASLLPTPTDASLNTLWSLAYTLCLSQLAIEGCAANVTPQESVALKARAQEFQPFVRAVLTALTLAYSVFGDSELREVLSDIQLNASYKIMLGE